MQPVNNDLKPLCVCLHCAPLRWRRCGASAAQIAESPPEAGSWPKGQHGRQLRLDLPSSTQGILALHRPSSLLLLKDLFNTEPWLEMLFNAVDLHEWNSGKGCCGAANTTCP